jgi:hypothetical protein
MSAFAGMTLLEETYIYLAGKPRALRGASLPSNKEYERRSKFGRKMALTKDQESHILTI